MEIGLNLNGDLTPKRLVKGSKAADVAGYHYLWIGEAAEYMHPFPILALVSQETQNVKVGTGIISPQLNRCYHIMTAFQTLRKRYGDRFVVGLASGDYRNLKITGALTSSPLQKVKKCVNEFRKSTTLPIYVGASGPKMAETASKIADGVLLNYVFPEFLQWAISFFGESNCRRVAYGPALLKPDVNNLDFLRVSAAVVFSGANKVFLEEFGLKDAASAVNEILEKRQFHKLIEYDGLLLEKFAIYGSLRKVEERIEALKALGMDQVVFATPLCRNFASVKKVGEAFSLF